MSWVVRFKRYFGVRTIRKLFISSFAFLSSCVALAKASTTGSLDPSSMVMRPMYGVIAPVVKYGPPNPTIAPFPGGSSTWFSWPATGIPQWSYQGQQLHFSAPDLSQWIPSVPKLLGVIGVITYMALILWAVCGWTVWGSVWYMKNNGKK